MNRWHDDASRYDPGCCEFRKVRERPAAARHTAEEKAPGFESKRRQGKSHAGAHYVGGCATQGDAEDVGASHRVGPLADDGHPQLLRLTVGSRGTFASASAAASSEVLRGPCILPALLWFRGHCRQWNRSCPRLCHHPHERCLVWFVLPSRRAAA